MHAQAALFTIYRYLYMCYKNMSCYMLQLETHSIYMQHAIYVCVFESSYLVTLCYGCRSSLHWVSYAIRLDKLVKVSVFSVMQLHLPAHGYRQIVNAAWQTGNILTSPTWPGTLVNYKEQTKWWTRTRWSRRP